MKLRPSTKNDLIDIMLFIKDAQHFLAALNINQWQDNYPNNEVINRDINNRESFVITTDKGKTIATSMFTINGESTYNFIKGNWITKNNTKYGVIHRIAVSNNARSKGVAKFIFNEFETRLQKMEFTSLRIDTHKDNHIMQQLLQNLGYVYCGVIYLNNGNERLAYEKVLF
ncbi:GNAT family N-acetyltransferase [Flavobacteriaceae bacterium]|nr:GNAT family N-acetyltransferase [Flavobacteriaceae bacterium]